MGNYTMPLKDVIESVFGTTMEPDDYEQEYISYSFNGVVYGKLPTVPDWTKIGLGTYPLFNEEYRPVLNGKIVDEYYNMEIGTETIDNWMLMIRRKMDQIMPYFNKLYLSELIPYDALDSMKIHSVNAAHINVEESGTASGDNSSDTASKNRAVQSNTPQTMLAGNADYATAASDTVSETEVKGVSTQESEATTKNSSDYDTLVTGYQGIASDLIMKYRNTLLNIDTSILNEIQDCFMLLLNNADSYTPQNYYYGWMH